MEESEPPLELLLLLLLPPPRNGLREETIIFGTERQEKFLRTRTFRWNEPCQPTALLAIVAMMQNNTGSSAHQKGHDSLSLFTLSANEVCRNAQRQPPAPEFFEIANTTTDRRQDTTPLPRT